MEQYNTAKLAWQQKEEEMKDAIEVGRKFKREMETLSKEAAMSKLLGLHFWKGVYSKRK